MQKQFEDNRELLRKFREEIEKEIKRCPKTLFLNKSESFTVRLLKK
jgi:hypothetical protein